MIKTEINKISNNYYQILHNDNKYICSKTEFKNGFRWILSLTYSDKMPDWVATEHTLEECKQVILGINTK